MIAPEKFFSLAVALRWLVGCDSEETQATIALDQAPQLLVPTVEAMPEVEVRQTADNQRLRSLSEYRVSARE